MARARLKPIEQPPRREWIRGVLPNDVYIKTNCTTGLYVRITREEWNNLEADNEWKIAEMLGVLLGTRDGIERFKKVQPSFHAAPELTTEQAERREQRAKSEEFKRAIASLPTGHGGHFYSPPPAPITMFEAYQEYIEMRSFEYMIRGIDDEDEEPEEDEDGDDGDDEDEEDEDFEETSSEAHNTA